MRLLICAGGTGGGVYPALAVHKALGIRAEATLWVGSEGGMEAELVQRESIPFTSIPAAGVHGVGLRALPGNLGRLARGYAAARRILRSFNPDVLLFTGGYVGVPMALAGSGRPSLVFIPDIEPGLALKVMARYAWRIAVTAPDSRVFIRHEPARVVVTGYPTRPDLSAWTRETGRQRLGLSPDEPVLLVAGGSKGARSINQALLAHLPDLLARLQVVHLTGRLDWPEVEAYRSRLDPALAERYHAFDYLHDMGAALAAADLAICRAGASTLGELPLFGLPAVLVPYPYAWRYQRTNAGYLEKSGAALVLEDARLKDRIVAVVSELFSDPHRLEAMRQAMQSLATPQAAEKIAVELANIAVQPQRSA